MYYATATQPVFVDVEILLWGVANAGGLRPSTPLRKVGLRPPWVLGPIWDGALGPMAPGPRVDLELFGPKMGFWEIEKERGPPLGPLGLKLGPNEADAIPGPYGSPPGPFWAHFGPENQKKYKNPKILKISEIWTLVNSLDGQIFKLELFSKCSWSKGCALHAYPLFWHSNVSNL